MLRPTLRSFHDFALALDKMLSENLNRSFFERDIPLEDRVASKDGTTEIRPVGTITLLERWFDSRYRDADGADVGREVLASFRETRRLRQEPAHRFGQDAYDAALPQRQDDLLTRTIHGLTVLRLIFSSHPRARGYKAPDWLDSDRIVFY